jgi:hypothetical protein
MPSTTQAQDVRVGRANSIPNSLKDDLDGYLEDRRDSRCGEGVAAAVAVVNAKVRCG